MINFFSLSGLKTSKNKRNIKFSFKIKMAIYIKIFAGLCNRIFQYSYGRHLISQGHKVKFIVADDGNTGILDIFDTGNDKKLFYTNSKNVKLYLELLS